ncbi:helix-turn-helix transcriptional regulator [Rubeoparvulum massiliense]|uniref:helix-turn-helix transcriptional regulator n=1 Tax=Rubeoparvulum massiliense TaxID=1631346 RepID=UPI00065E2ED4|nr:helix-turn-helix domain-containing protein [Rubeoparvulum massiliense]
MNEDALKLTNVLSDPTRFSIYQYVTRKHDTVIVQEIAEVFHIHPNVARLHLSKLEDVRLLQSTTEKNGKGGRPSRLYYLSDEVISLQFPPRDYTLLIRVLMDTLSTFGEQGCEALIQVGEQFGIEAAKLALQQESKVLSQMSDEEKINSIERVIVAQGLNPELKILDNKSIQFMVHNCTFKEPAEKHPDLVCEMHHALLKGIFATYFDKVNFTQGKEKIACGSGACSYTVVKID